MSDGVKNAGTKGYVFGGILVFLLLFIFLLIYIYKYNGLYLPAAN